MQKQLSDNVQPEKGEHMRTDKVYCPYCGAKMSMVRRHVCSSIQYYLECKCGICGPLADFPEVAQDKMEQFIAKIISRSLEIGEGKIRGEIIYLQEKLK